MTDQLDRLDEVLADIGRIDLAVVSSLQLVQTQRRLRSSSSRLEVEIARVLKAVEESGVWREQGATSVEAWLADQTNSSLRTARTHKKIAETLAKAPAAAKKVASGEMSLDNVLELSAVVDHEAFAGEAESLIETACTSRPADTRKAFQHWRATADGKGEEQREANLRVRRHLHLTPNADGMVDVPRCLMPEDAAVVKTTLDHIAGTSWEDNTGRSYDQRCADALVELCNAYNRGEVTGGRECPRVLALVPFETVTERAAARGVMLGFDDYGTVSASAARKLAGDAGISRLITMGNSIVLDLGTTTRLATESQFLAMAARDQGCRIPGCDRPPGWCDAHHIDEVLRDNGPTDLSNMVLLCSAHHTMVHTGELTLHGDATTLTIRLKDGTAVAAPSTRFRQQCA